MRSCLLAVLLSCLSGSFLLAQGDFYLPQVANGQAEGLGIRTTFVFFNPTDSALGAELSLTDSDGNPMVVSLGDLGDDDTFSLALGPGETLFLETDGQGPMKVGAATIQSGQALGVSAVFTISRGADSFVTEAGVGGSVPQAAFVAPVDTTGSFDTGLALFNVGLMQASLTLRLVNTAGAVTATATRTLPARGQRALYVSELFQGLGTFRGTLRVESTRPVAGTVLRQNLTTLTATTLPVVGAVSQQTEFSLPQVATGTYPGGSIRTSFIIFNLGQAAAEVDVALTSGEGSPFPISIPGVVQNNSSFRVNLAPGGAAFLETGVQGAVRDGAAAVKSNVPIGLSSIFTLYDLSGGFETEAGVGDSRALSSFTIPVDTTGTFDTGVALFNPGVVGSNITVRLLDSAGSRLSSVALNLVPGGHKAFMAKQEFPGGVDIQGSLAITASSPLSALTLRLHAQPLSYTTLPTAASAFAGFVPRPPLLAGERTGIEVQEAVVNADIELAPGVKLSGLIGGQPAAVQAVMARSGDGKTIAAQIDSVRRSYSLAVPAGSYTLVTCYKPSIGTFQGAPVLIYERPEIVQVGATTRADIVLPSVPLFNVSGIVEGLGNQTLTALVRLTGEGGARSAEGFISLDHRFSLYVPAGTYVVSLAVTHFNNSRRNELAFYNVGAVTVTGSDVETSFSVPELSTLSGRLDVAEMPTFPAGSFVTAREAGPGVQPAGSCLPDPARSVLAVDATGSYGGTLATNRPYDLTANLKLSSAGDAPVISFPLAPRRITLAGSRTETFSLPALPGNRSLAGVVRASGGAAVADALVVATSQELNGLSQAGVRVVGRTNARGEFSLSVPAGTNYRLEIIPPAP